MTKEDFEKQLDELSKLEKGWLNGVDAITPGSKISYRSISATHSLVTRLTKLGMEYPYIYPMYNGGIRLEWDDHILINIGPKGKLELLIL